MMMRIIMLWLDTGVGRRTSEREKEREREKAIKSQSLLKQRSKGTRAVERAIKCAKVEYVYLEILGFHSH